ncbi:cytochrome P450 [Daldinia caldariorum]|uniref:cytochrome P450 n=1 Tax=Daldinia caldariorum TaxID=326644 RepID=UPI002007F7B6|nr:cytochrome P450 [Daldinia caldariorum]KAI1469973.1 cytochrome P450 [Daldinia caldariorum]
MDVLNQNMSFPGWLLATFVISFLMFLANSIYNLFFHPLAHIPGPFFARMSGIPSWYHAHQGDRYIWLGKQFQKYGDKIRAEPNTVLFNTPEAYEDIYAPKSNVRRSRFYEAWQLNGFKPTTLSTTDVAEHARKRKLLSHAFTEKSVRAASDFVVQNLDRWHELLIEDASCGWSPAVDISEKLDELAFDIMGDLSFGKSFNVKEPGDNNPFKNIPHNITDYSKLYNSVARSPWLDQFLWLKPRGLDWLLSVLTPSYVRQYQQFVHDSVTERIALYEKQVEKPESERRRDMFYYMCDARDPDTGLPAYEEDELRGEANLLIIAGSDTSAASLSGIFFYLTGDSNRYEKLVREIRSEFQSVDDIVYGPRLFSLEYLRACIDEGMRLTPAAPGDLPREVLTGGLKIQGEYYPKGTVVGTSNWVLSHKQDVYGDPDAFRPERWIVDETTGVTEEDVIRAQSCSRPFSRGPGRCLGQNFAIMKITMIVARTLYRLDVRREPSTTLGTMEAYDRNHFQLFDGYILFRHGPKVQFRKRQLGNHA